MGFLCLVPKIEIPKSQLPVTMEGYYRVDCLDSLLKLKNSIMNFDLHIVA